MCRRVGACQRNGLGPVTLGTTGRRVLAKLGAPEWVTRGLLRYCLTAGGSLLVGERGRPARTMFLSTTSPAFTLRGEGHRAVTVGATARSFRAAFPHARSLLRLGRTAVVELPSRPANARAVLAAIVAGRVASLGVYETGAIRTARALAGYLELPRERSIVRSPPGAALPPSGAGAGVDACPRSRGTAGDAATGAGGVDLTSGHKSVAIRRDLQAFADTMIPGRRVAVTDLGNPIDPVAIAGVDQLPGAVEADALLLYHDPEVGFDALEAPFLADLAARSLLHAAGLPASRLRGPRRGLPLGAGFLQADPPDMGSGGGRAFHRFLRRGADPQRDRSRSVRLSGDGAARHRARRLCGLLLRTAR